MSAGKLNQEASVQGLVTQLALILMLVCSLASADTGANDTASDVVLSLQGHSLSLKGDDARLGEVLRELARQAGFDVYIADIAARKRIQISFDNIPLDQGIREILRGESYVVVWNDPASPSERSAPRNVVAVKILSNGSDIHKDQPGRLETRAPLDQHAKSKWSKSINELVRRASNEKAPAVRADALKSLRKHEKVEGLRSVFIDAVNDSAPEVRKAALVNLDEWKGKPPFELVAELALKDESPAIRKHAFQVLTYEYSEEAPVYLRQGLKDPDSGIRAYTGERLDELEGNLDDFDGGEETANPW